MSREPPEPPAEPDPSAGSDQPSLHHRLDPDLAAGAARREPPRLPPPVIDTRRYRWAIGIFGLVLVIAFSVEQFASNGVRSAGIAPGHKLRFFAAPLAASTLSGGANLDPPCTLAKHDPRALNICLLARDGPLALAFFSPASEDCKHEVDALQAVARKVPPGSVQFAAVAVSASQAQTATLVRSHHWTIPVAYDVNGTVGSIYDVQICPIVELAYRGGIVKDRLIGNHWLQPTALAARVRALIR